MNIVSLLELLVNGLIEAEEKFLIILRISILSRRQSRAQLNLFQQVFLVKYYQV